MTTAGLPATNRQKAEELDSMKESISDIINQLQDIDPTRLSFSPFLDLDTQISLAPVSDSPESSVEELRSSSHSVSGSQNSLEPAPAAPQPTSGAPGHGPPGGDPLPDQPQADRSRVGEGAVVGAEQGEPDRTLSGPTAAARDLDGRTEQKRAGCAPAAPAAPAARPDVPNGTDPTRWSPHTSNREEEEEEEEGRPLIAPPPESVELAVWSPEGGGEPGPAAPGAPPPGGCCRCCCCCRGGRLPALCSVLASLLCAAAGLYGLYFYVPIKPPDCPDPARRVVFTLCCCVVAAVPVLLVMLLGAVCQFCTGSLDLQEAAPAGRSVQRLFVAGSLQLLFLYVLNLVVMATLLPQDQLKLVPILVAMFILGRLVYWVSLNTCSSWRGFGSGLTVFPLLAMVALNLFLIYSLNLKEPLFGSQDVLYNQVTAPSWSGETSQSPSGTPDILDAQ